MTKILLQSYKNEYQTTDISIEDLCLKYDISTSDLKGYTKWDKTISQESTIVLPKDSEEISETQTEALDVTVIDKPEEVNKTQKEILADIDTFKKQAVKECLRFIKDDARYAEVKEFKDMVAIVDSIEKSYKDTKDPEGTTINVLIQNLTQKFKDTPDDC